MIDGVNIQEVSTVKYLIGVTFDSNLTWKIRIMLINFA